MTSQDTIAAIATAPGQGGVGIVRISGAQAEQVLMQVFRPGKAAPLTSHMLTYGYVMDGGERVDECMAVLMRAPRSYTREDVAELQLHGGTYLCQRVLSLCLRCGARLAGNGHRPVWPGGGIYGAGPGSGGSSHHIFFGDLKKSYTIFYKNP